MNVNAGARQGDDNHCFAVDAKPLSNSGFAIYDSVGSLAYELDQLKAGKLENWRAGLLMGEFVDGPKSELDPFLAILVEVGVSWAVKELCGRAIAAVSRGAAWTLAAKAERRRGAAGIYMRRIELFGNGLDIWSRYQKMRDEERLLLELRDLVISLESLELP